MKTLKTILLGLTAILTLGFSSAFAGGVDYTAYVVYGENIQSPMSGIVANLYNADGEYIATSITDEDGIFEFNNLTAGESYSVHFFTDLEPFGVDLADAYLLLEYLNGKADLSELQLQAADVNGDTKVDYSDFNFIVSQWYLRGEDFPAGDWVLPVWTFTPSAFKSVSDEDEKGPDGPITVVSQSDVSHDLPPVIKDAKNVTNHLKEFTYTDSQQELRIPLSFVNNQMIYGLGLEMAFDNSAIEIVGLHSIFNDLEYLIKDNTFKLSWVSDMGASIVADQDFIELTVRLNTSDDIETVLSALSEAQFIGEGGSLLKDVQLNMPKLKKSIVEISIGNPFPNPGNSEISFAINQAYATDIQVEIYNLRGQLVKQINASAMNSKITISTSDLPNGSYLCSLNINEKREVKLINVQH
ncbi:MAG: T9SS type A sorting domain-containing protein [Bacteroidales bacterium]|nr:T9SS type A sorting domain-containing protein [Bacteroidales bacterium]